MIKQITNQGDFVALAKLLNEAFGTVACEFGLTKEKAPTNSAFITNDELRAQLTENREYYAYWDTDSFVGFVAIEKSLTTQETFYIEKLAVIPGCRHRGIGRLLMDFATNRIAELGGKCISIALINSNVVLKNWYLNQGFEERSIKTFDHLPFEVCYLKKNSL